MAHLWLIVSEPCFDGKDNLGPVVSVKSGNRPLGSEAGME